MIFLIAGVGAIAAQVKSAPHSHFVLSSPDARLALRVPEEYTANVFGCPGGNMSPALQWSGAPAGTKSFVVTLFDPDVPETGSGWWHWVVYDLPANATSLPKERVPSTARHCRLERNKAEPIWGLTHITVPAPIKDSLLITTGSRFMH